MGGFVSCEFSTDFAPNILWTGAWPTQAGSFSKRGFSTQKLHWKGLSPHHMSHALKTFVAAVWQIPIFPRFLGHFRLRKATRLQYWWQPWWQSYAHHDHHPNAHEHDYYHDGWCWYNHDYNHDYKHDGHLVEFVGLAVFSGWFGVFSSVWFLLFVEVLLHSFLVTLQKNRSSPRYIKILRANPATQSLLASIFSETIWYRWPFLQPFFELWPEKSLGKIRNVFDSSYWKKNLWMLGCHMSSRVLVWLVGNPTLSLRVKQRAKRPYEQLVR